MQSFLRRGCFLASILVVLLYVPSAAVTNTATRIELNDGTVYQSVSYSVDRQFKVVYVTVDGDKKTHSFTDIHLIISDEGEDITEEVTGLRPAAKPQPKSSPATTEQTVGEVAAQVPSSPVVAEPAGGTAQPADQGWMSTSEQAQRYSGRPFDVSLNVHGSLSIPLGTWFEGFSAGPGFGADIVVPVGKRIGLRGSINKAGVKMEDFDVDTWRYLFGVQFYNWPRWREDGRMVYNLWSQIGVTTHSAFGGMASLTKFTTNSGGSIIVMTSETVGLEFSGNADVLWIGSVDDNFSYGTYGNVQTAVIIDLRLGFVIML